LGYLGVERYGLWIVISSTIAILGFADLGMGNGLINAISEAHGKGDNELADRYVSSAFFMLTSIALVLGILFVFLYPHVSWPWLFNISSNQARNEAGPAIIIFVVCFLVNLPLGIVQRIQIGYQEGFFNSIWQALGNLFGLGSVLLAIHLKANLPWLVFAMAGVPILATAMNGLVLFCFRRPWLIPKIKFVSFVVAQRVLKTGFLFLILQIAGAIGYQSDNFVISHFLGASYVPQYSIPMKLFMQVPLLLGFVLSPLWPAYGEAITRRDVAWIRKTFSRSIKFSLSVNIIPALLLIIYAPAIINIWVGSKIMPPFILLLGLGIWTILTSLGGPIAVLLNGTGAIKIQIICASLMGISNILVSIFLVSKIGVAGPIYGTLITWTFFNLIPLLIYIPRMFASWKPVIIEPL
jgi:O-antigen/teichoic acid export membrane protein